MESSSSPLGCLGILLLRGWSWRPSGFSVIMHAIQFLQGSAPSNTSLFSQHHVVDNSEPNYFSSVSAASQALWTILVTNPGPLPPPQEIMKTCHLVSGLLTGFACGVLCAHDENQSGGAVIDTVEDAVGGSIAQAGDLASVSLPPPSLGVPQSRGNETMKQTKEIDIIIDTYRLTSQGSRGHRHPQRNPGQAKPSS